MSISKSISDSRVILIVKEKVNGKVKVTVLVLVLVIVIVMAIAIKQLTVL